jgi:hypothetical protein
MGEGWPQRLSRSLSRGSKVRIADRDHVWISKTSEQ